MDISVGPLFCLPQLSFVYFSLLTSLYVVLDPMPNVSFFPSSFHGYFSWSPTSYTDKNDIPVL